MDLRDFPTPKSAPSPGEIAVDFGKTLLQSAVIDPVWNGAGQLVSLGHLPQVDIVNHENAKASKVDYWAQDLARGMGVAADMAGLYILCNRGLPGSGLTSQLGVGERTYAGARMGAGIGAFYGAFLTPSDKADNLTDLLTGRIENGLILGIEAGVVGGMISSSPERVVGSSLTSRAV